MFQVLFLLFTVIFPLICSKNVPTKNNGMINLTKSCCLYNPFDAHFSKKLGKIAIVIWKGTFWKKWMIVIFHGKQMIMGKIFGWVHFFCKWKRGLLCLSIRQLVTQERWFIAFFSSTYMFPFVRHFTFYHKFLLVHIKERIRAYLIW